MATSSSDHANVPEISYAPGFEEFARNFRQSQQIRLYSSRTEQENLQIRQTDAPGNSIKKKSIMNILNDIGGQHIGQ